MTLLQMRVPACLSAAAAACAALVLSACVTEAGSGPMPVPLGDGVYSMGSAHPGDGSGLQDESYQRAIRFCFDRGKQLLRVDGEGAAMSGRPGGEIRFRCVGPGEPGWKQPLG
jgi:hypothetical protein